MDSLDDCLQWKTSDKCMRTSDFEITFTSKTDCGLHMLLTTKSEYNLEGNIIMSIFNGFQLHVSIFDGARIKINMFLNEDTFCCRGTTFWTKLMITFIPR